MSAIRNLLSNLSAGVGWAPSDIEAAKIELRELNLGLSEALGEEIALRQELTNLRSQQADRMRRDERLLNAYQAALKDVNCRVDDEIWAPLVHWANNRGDGS